MRRVASGGDTDRTRSTGQRDAHVERCVADDHRVGSYGAQTADTLDGRQRNRQQSIPVVNDVAERAARKVAPEIEVLELDPRAPLEVSGEQRKKYIVMPGKGVEKLTHARHHAFAGTGLVQFRCQIFKVQGLEGIERVRGDAMNGSGLRQDPGVRASVEGNAAKGVRDAIKILERAGHGAAARAARKHKSAVDVEKKECLQTGTPPLPLTFAAHVARARPFRGRFLIKADALAFVELVEVALN